MDSLDRQTAYWDRVAGEKRFSNPLDESRFARLVPKSARILDLGCGYGRLCGQLLELGYNNLTGLDISPEMIRLAGELYPTLDFRVLAGDRIPFGDAGFDAVLIVAVLTCIPGDDAQKRLISEARRVLKPGGVIFVSDYPIQSDDRNQARYREFEKKYDRLGVFELPEGVVLRHQDMGWVGEILSPFRQLDLAIRDVVTMNGHAAKIFQYFGEKVNPSGISGVLC
ncbi:class I SAM-dependent methyltransferase [bacterium]|nr:class I SAM-dependent methyltransferase [bacterium]